MLTSRPLFVRAGGPSTWLCILTALFLLLPATGRQAEAAFVHVATTHIPAEVAAAKPLGRMAPVPAMTIDFVLPLRNQADLQVRLARIVDPNDSLYGHYLTPRQFADAYGPSVADVNAIAQFAKSKGLTLASVSGNRTLVQVAGSSSAVETAFGVQLDDYQSADGHVFFAPAREPLFPADIAARIVGLIGLDNAQIYHANGQLTGSLGQGTFLPDFARPLGSTSQGVAGTFGAYLAPSDFKSIYNIPNVTSPGAGQTLAVFELDTYTPSDITGFENDFFPGLTPVALQNVNVDNPSSTPAGGAGEVTLDIELEIALCPYASKIIVYDAPNNLTDGADEYARIASDDLASVVSSSWGVAEAGTPAPSFAVSENQSFQQMAAQGQSMFAASGDSGAYANESSASKGTLSVLDPGSQPYVTAVGGTLLNDVAPSPFTYVSESAWGDTADTGRGLSGAGSGGGISAWWPISSYQHGFVTQTNLGSNTQRNVPDVSIFGDYDEGGYAIYITPSGSTSGLYGFNGTSAAAPLWAAYTALVDQGRASNGTSKIGFLNPAVYSLAANTTTYNNDFHDIKDGTTNLYYPAVTGYDLATGLGSPKGTALYNDLVAYGVPTITGFSPASGPVSTVVTITGSNFTGAMTVSFNGTASTAFTVVSATSITATVPAGATTGKIAVGTGVSVGTFTVTIIPPTVTLTEGTQTATTAPCTASATSVDHNPLAYTWSVSPAATPGFTGSTTGSTSSATAFTNTLTVGAAGVYTITVTAKDDLGQTATATKTVTFSQIPTTVTISPRVAVVPLKGSQAFTAVVSDQFGNAVASPSVVWSVSGGGIINASTGVFTAGTAGATVVVTATSSGITGTATLLVVAPPTVTLVVGTQTTTQASFTATPSSRGGVPLSYVWSVSPTATFTAATAGSESLLSPLTNTLTVGAAGSYTVTVKITDSVGQTASASQTVTFSQIPTTVTVSPLGGVPTFLVRMPAGGTQAFTAAVADQFGNAVASPSVVWSVSGGGTINASTGVFMAGMMGFVYIVTATCGGIATNQDIGIITVPTMTLAVGTQTSTQASCTATPSSQGGVPLSYVWSVSPAATFTGATAGSDSLSSPLTNTLTVGAAGSYTVTVTVTDSVGQTATASQTVTFSQIPTTVTVSPSNPVNSLPIRGTQTFTASVADQFGNAVASPSIAWSVSGGGTIDQNGTFTASGPGGAFTVTATSGAATGAATVIVIAPPTLMLNPGTQTGTQASFTATPSSQGGVPLSYVWSVSPAVTFTGATAGSDATGTAFTNTLTVGAAGSYTVTVTVTDSVGQTASASQTVTFSQIPTTVTVSPGNPNYQILPSARTQTFTASVTDQFGNAVAAPTVLWSVSGGGTIDQNGTFTAGTAFATLTVTATCGAATGMARAIVVPLPTVTLAVGTQTGTQASFTATPSSRGGVPLSYVWSVSPAATFMSAIAGNEAMVTPLTNTLTVGAAGSYTVTVTVTDSVGQTASASQTVTFSQVPTTVTVSPNPAALSVGGTQTFTASATDQFGNVIAAPTVLWSVTGGGTINAATSVFTAGTTPGTSTVTATSGGVSGTASVTVTDAAPTVATAASATPNPVTGTTTSLSVLGAYAGGESALVYTWSASPSAGVTFSANGTNGSKTTTATFTAAGTYTFTVTISNPSGQTVTSTVTVVVNQTPMTVSVTPTTATLNIGGTQTFTASVTDQFGTAITGATFIWSRTGVGGITGAGVYTAGLTPGTAIVTASTGGAAGAASITVGDVNPTLGSITVNPNPVTGTTATLTVTGSYVGSGGLTYLWETVTAPAGGSVTFSGGTSGASGSAVTTTATFTKAGPYTVRVTVSDTNGGTAVKTVTFTVNQTGTTVVVSPTAASVGLSATQQFTAQEIDQFGDPLATQPTFTWSVSSGSGTVSASGLYTAPILPGTATVKAVSTDSLFGTASVTITNTPPTVSQQAAANGTTVSYTTTANTVALTVLGAYIGGEGTLTYTWSYTGGTGVTFSGATNGTNAAKNLTATFTNANTVTFLVTITDPLGASVTSTVNVTINQSLTTITVTPNPDTEVIGSGTQTFTAVASDQFGNPLGTQPAFTWSTTGVGSVNSGSGVYTIGTTPGTATIKAVSGGVTGTASVTVNDVAPTVATAASATPNPVTGTTTALSVLGQYTGGESNLTYTWSASPSAGVSFSANGTNAAKNTTATFTAAGTYTFTVTIADAFGGSVTSTVTVVVSQTATTVTVTPSTKTLSIGGTQTFTASVTDQFGAAITGATFTWSRTGVGSVTGNGVYTAGLTPGTATITVSTNGVSTTASVTVLDATPTVSTAASATPNPVSGATTVLSVLGAYTGGEGSLTYTWSASPSAGVTFSVNGTNGAKNTTATFTAAGTYTFTVTIADAFGGSVTSTVTVVVSQTATTVTVTPTTATLNIGGTQTFTASVTDQFGAAITGATFTWSSTGVGSVNSSGVYTAGLTPGTAIVTASTGGAAGTATVTVNDVAPTVSTAASATPNPVTGTTTALSVLGAYTGGESALTYTWSASPSTGVTFSDNGDNTAKTATATFMAAGTYTFTVTMTDPYGGSVTSTVTVVVSQTATTVTVAPSSASLALSGTQAFAATATDQFGNAITSPSIAWSISSGGTIDQNGNFTAGTSPGTFTVTATSSNASGTATVTVNDIAPTVATAASATPNPVTGTTTALSVLGAYTGGESALTYTWSASPSAGVSFSVNGTNAAKNTTATFTAAGTYTFTVTVADPYGAIVTSTVIVVVSQTATTVTVSPSSASLALSGTQTFTALMTDQFGNAIASPSIAWSVSGGGTIDQNGTFTAGTVPGVYTVTATAQGGGASQTATASVTVTDVAPTVASAASATPSPVTGTTTSLSVLGAYAGGESNLTYAWNASPSAGVTFSVSRTNAAKDTTATFTQAGTYAITVTIADPYGASVMSTVTVRVYQTSIRVTVSPSSATLAEQGTQTFTATVTDQFGNVITAPAVSWSVSGGGTINATTGVFTAGTKAGTFTVTAKAVSGGVTKTGTGTVTVVAPPTVVLTLGTPTSATAPFTTTGTSGNGTALTYAWSVSPAANFASATTGSAASGAAFANTLTVTAAGTYTVTVKVTDTYGQTATATKTATFAQAPTTVTVAPSIVTVPEGGTQTFTATVKDQFGVTFTPATLTWSVAVSGTINAITGAYTAGMRAGTFTVTAKAVSGGVTKTGTAAVTVAAPPTVVLTLGTQTSVAAPFTATGTSGNGTALTYAWSVSPAATFASATTGGTASGAAFANTLTVTAAGTYTVTVKVTDAYGQTATATKTVTFAHLPTTVIVSPPSATVAAQGTQTFTATVKDQFGVTFTPALTWSVSGGGTINASTGVFTAKTTAGTFTVTAKAVSGGVTKTGTATITVL